MKIWKKRGKSTSLLHKVSPKGTSRRSRVTIVQISSWRGGHYPPTLVAWPRDSQLSSVLSRENCPQREMFSDC